MSNERKVTAMHPAWQCAHRKLTNQQRWDGWEAALPGGYYDSEIALAMIVGGYGADVIVTARGEEGNPETYAFPDKWVVINEDAGGRVGPHPRLLREVHGDPLNELVPLAYPVSARMLALNGRR